MYDVVFFDVPKIGLTRYPTDISNVLSKSIDKEKICFLHFHKDNVEKEITYNTSNIREINIKRFIKENKNAVFVFFSNRIPDLYLLLLCKKYEVKTVMIQHGVIVDGNTIDKLSKKNVLESISRIGKSLSYLNLTRKMCRIEKTSFINMINHLMKSKMNFTLFLQNYFSFNLIADKALVYGEYWQKFYHEEYGYDNDKIEVVGYPELDDLAFSEFDDYGVCYIAQTLVEDGIITKERFTHTINLLSVLADTKKVIIKLHPRSDIKLFKTLADKVTFEKGKNFPNASSYLGHNSTLNTKALFLDKPLEIIQYEEMSKSSYQEYAKKIYDINYKMEVRIVNNSGKNIDKLKKKYLWNKTGSINTISEQILHVIKEA